MTLHLAIPPQPSTPSIIHIHHPQIVNPVPSNFPISSTGETTDVKISPQLNPRGARGRPGWKPWERVVDGSGAASFFHILYCAV
ncbi:predicted protein [Plenodomus lingam JN3]|uniref:Predicted protein n=1 Tax=Leptosphaeria maculans (strain JN3 / isolate v23.1.3 / race Av1-4-5-6-7-8) TaxID=985895 RepID=E5A9B3_LEPMJ|nr:predicted protein [Plenodomus lingam JN3]CBY00254.1 predicted protein [Plenodomus lingam JN3]